MKELSEREFQKRLHQVRDAQRIFGHMTEQNISLAYRIYRDIFDEKDLPEVLTYRTAGKFHTFSLRPYKRPKCPLCGSALHLRRIGVRQGKANVHGYKSCWECTKDDCYYEQYSIRDIKWQAKQLKIKGES